ncbi:carboxypeptidase-like regulatory domain-containing protein [Pontibacter harenae]|uniref:carboxypeptidase-like regulatory domain-containing protein n=1 Tax=Pontibacter harenae TaxID=2894083 RepID=UPI001E29A89C|nr:carboxypeptidase-like regulatory domain-containing protein [Pontibacter harenae]MCC9167312.1 carboxypeptidase-like regulatory domain-containing protein [Pontibacter harenae]
MAKLYLLPYLLLFIQWPLITVTGSVVDQEGKPLPNCEVKIAETAVNTFTDLEGKFTIKTSLYNTKNFDVLLTTDGAPTYRITGVKYVNDSIYLGRMELRWNKFLEVQEYESLSKADKTKCRAISHWGKLLGYQDITELDKSTAIPCPTDSTQMLFFNYEKGDNEIRFSYEQLINCK